MDGASDEKERRRDRGHSHRDRSARTSPLSTASSSSSDGDSSDGDKRRRDRKQRKAKEKERKTHHRHKSDKARSSKEERRKSKDEKKLKRKRKHVGDDDTDTNSSEERKKRRLLKEAKKLLKKHRAEAEAGPNKPTTSLSEMDKISEEHYYEKSNEFATWLKESKGIFFSNLSSEETHKLFTKFVDMWNAGELSPKYYQGIKTAQRTTHQWGIKMNRAETLALGMDEEDKILEKKREKLERKKYHKQQGVVMDELLPKATGREAVLEKKALRREQARAREDSPEIMKERDVMGGGDDFQQRLARERAWRERKAAEKANVYMEKRSVYEEKEMAAMNQFKALVNVAGGKISIPKRLDPPVP